MSITVQSQKIDLSHQDLKDNPSFFHENENGRFYKHKLIFAEEVITRTEIDTKDNNEFLSHRTDTSYILTFEDNNGNHFKYKNNAKPKNIGFTFYYIIDEHNDMIDIFPEHDKNSLTKYLTAKGEYKYNNITHKICHFYITNMLKVFAIGTPICSLMLIIFNAFPSVDHDRAILFVFLSILLIAVSYLPFIFTGHIYEKKANKFISDKEYEEKQALLNSFE